MSIAVNTILIFSKTFGQISMLVALIVGFVAYKVIKINLGADDMQKEELLIESIIDNTYNIEKKVKEYDELFLANEFIGWAKEVFLNIQVAWEERDWERIKPFESEDLYNRHELELREYIEEGIINRLKGMNVTRAFLTGYKRDKEYEYLTMYIQIRVIDYIVDDTDEDIIEGSDQIPVTNNYTLTFVRRVEALTDIAESNRNIIECTNCGVLIQVISEDNRGICGNCGKMVVIGEHDWVLDGMESTW